MPVSARKIPFVILVVLLTGCTVVEKVRLIAAEGAARAVVAECALSRSERSKNLTAVNVQLMAGEYPHRALALDCDGDGASDF